MGNRLIQWLALVAFSSQAAWALGEEQPVPLGLAPRQQDVALIESCLADLKDGDEMERCVGLVANACQVEFNTISTQGIIQCLDMEKAVWAPVLRRSLAIELTYARKTEAAAIAESGDPAYFAIEANLHAAQEAWIAFVETECRYRQLSQGLAAEAKIHGAACELQEIGHRAASTRLQTDFLCGRREDCRNLPDWTGRLLPGDPVK